PSTSTLFPYTTLFRSQNFFYRFGSLFYLFFGCVLLSGCATSSAVVENDNTGLYSSTKNPVNRITINYDSSRDLYTIQLNNTDGEDRKSTRLNSSHVKI